MKKIGIITTTLLCAVLNTTAFAASPLPSFDKTAVTEYPYYRTGKQEAEVENRLQQKEAYQPGNTGTQENPAFYVKSIKLTGFVLPEVHQNKKLADILAAYTHRSVAFEELQLLTDEVTKYARDCGFTVSQAVVPEQEITNGELEVAVYAASYDDIKVVQNTSKVADRVLVKFLEPRIRMLA